MDFTPEIVGHRGAALLEPENTLAAFRRGVADGASAIECDVHLSRDGHVVVMHDETIDRTAAPHSPRRRGAIADLTRAELDEVLLPGDQRVPSLAEFLDVAAAGTPELGPAGVLVEVKAPEAAREVARQLRERFGESPEPLRGGTPPAVVISFHPEALAAVREEAPEIPIGYLVNFSGGATERILRELRAERLCMSIRGADRADAQLAARAGASFHVWTVNTAKQITKALAVGAASITTDDPAWAASEVAWQRENLSIRVATLAP